MSVSEQVKKLRDSSDVYKAAGFPEAASIMLQAADTIESLSAKLQAANMERPAEDCCRWIPCSEPPKHTNEVLIFNGKSYSVGYYDGKTWVNAIHPIEWQEIRHEP